MFGAPAGCRGPDLCREGGLETEACGAEHAGTRTRTCVQGRWADFSPCVPARPEVCDGLDDHHDGQVGEGLLGRRSGAGDLPCQNSGR